MTSNPEKLFSKASSDDELKNYSQNQTKETFAKKAIINLPGTVKFVVVHNTEKRVFIVLPASPIEQFPTNDTDAETKIGACCTWAPKWCSLTSRDQGR